MHVMLVTSMTSTMTMSSRAPIKLPTMMAMSMLLSSVVVVSVVVVSVVVPSGEKEDYNVSFFVDHSHSHIEHTHHFHWYPYLYSIMAHIHLGS